MVDFEILRGRVVFVTGGSRGLGKAFAMELAQHGARVAIVARDAAELEATAATFYSKGLNVVAIAADVTDQVAIASAVQLIEERLGPVDLLINAAGACLPIGPTWDLAVDDWWRVMEINVKGSLICSNAVLPGMITRRRGRIINIASSTVLAGRPYLSAYSTSKTAVVKFTEILATELIEYNIPVFAIHPGTVNTAMAQSLLRPENVRWIPWFKAIFQEHRDDPASVGSQLILYLASGYADSLTGRFFLVPTTPNQLEAQAEQIKTTNSNVLRVRFLENEEAHINDRKIDISI
jgi:NAD(P)-dependent dehydrogenase (short-subunit alcohol dehydrogenase family)